MNESTWADELAFATDLAHRAGEVLRNSYEHVEHIDYKSARDVVTDVDYRSEALLIDAIRAVARPSGAPSARL